MAVSTSAVLTRHQCLMLAAYKAGYDDPVLTPNPYSRVSQAARYHAYIAGRHDWASGFNYEDLEV